MNLPKPASQPTNIEIANPFTQKQTAAQKAVADRTAELERLQSITTPTAGVHAEYFPKTTADLSFTDRLANTAAGLEPYKDLESYKKPDFLGEDEEFFNRLRAQNFEKFCERRPDDPDCVKLYCKQHPDDEKCKKTTPTQQTDPNQVVNPPTGCPEIADHRDPKTCQCYKSDFMDSADCKCRGESKWDATKKKCVCPITDTSNLSIDEWGHTTTMCSCLYNKLHKKYNSANGMCKEDTTTPPDNKKYVIMQCVLKSYQAPFEPGNNLSKSTIIDQCTSTYGNSNDECFTRCMNGYNTADRQSKGYINSIANISTPWCAYSRHSDTETSSGTLATKPVPFFSAAQTLPTVSDPSFQFNNYDKKPSNIIQPLTFSKNEKDAIITNIKNALPNKSKCKVDRYHHYWHIYALQIISDDQYKVIDRVEIDTDR